ncbi:hypothetical protein BC629DRAFT_322455 [Irpex lacteus]|nr:hypothetical protein BC629DRAFT_322455 [Irpex lacteus]
MEEKIIKFMEDSRNFMLSEKQRVTLSKRFEALHSVVKRIVAGIPELKLVSALEVALHVPGVEKLLSAKPTTDPDAFDIQKLQRFLQKAIPTYIESRDNETKEALVNLVRESCDLDPSCDPLSLRLAVGSLHICSAQGRVGCINVARTIPHALRHQCPASCSTEHYLPLPEGVSETYYAEARKTFSKQVVWIPRAFASPTYSDAARAITVTAKVVSLCGFDVKTATVEDLDRADVRVCRRHGSIDQCQWVAIMPWRTAVFEMHKVPYPESYDFPEYSKASSAQVAAAKALEPAARKVEFSCREACDEFRCALCQFPGGVAAWTSKATVLGHIQDSHNIAEPLEDHWVDEQSTIPIPSPVYLVSEELRGKIDGTLYVRHIERNFCREIVARAQ